MKTDKKKKRTWIIYLLTSPSGKMYVGQTCCGFNVRWTRHCRDANNENANGYNYPLARAIRKYTSDSFKFKILHDNITTKARTDKLEKLEIKSHNCLAPNGYNQSYGGECGCLGYKWTNKQKANASTMQTIAQNRPDIRLKKSITLKVTGAHTRQNTIDKMIGKRFGRLTVISCDEKNTSRYLYLTCLCTCGKIRNKCNRSSLIDGKLTSCGCAYQDAQLKQKANTIKSMAGKTFSRLTVLQYNKKTSVEKGSDYYTCRCSCGSTVIMCGNRMRFGTTKSCGCILREITIKRNKLGKQRKLKA